MARPAKVENFLGDKRGCFIHVDSGIKGCVNCIWYEPYFRQGRGNVYHFVQTDLGSCTLSDKRRGALQKPCKCYETNKNAASVAVN